MQNTKVNDESIVYWCTNGTHVHKQKQTCEICEIAAIRSNYFSPCSIIRALLESKSADSMG